MKNRVDVIEEYTKHVKLSIDKWTNTLEPAKIVIFDLDGVIADVRHRIHFIDRVIARGKYHGIEVVGNKSDWDKFFKACPDDTPNKDMVDLLKIFVDRGHKIYILSGRSASVKKETFEWFSHYNIPFDFMFLRPVENYEIDFSLKFRWINKIIELEGLDKIFMAFDDNVKNVEVFRNVGIQSFLVVINYEV